MPKNQPEHHYDLVIEYWTPIHDGIMIDSHSIKSHLKPQELINFLKYNANVKRVSVFKRED
jgi:hypothetical protein